MLAFPYLTALEWPCIGTTHANSLNLYSFKFSENVMPFIFGLLSFINAFSTTFQLHIPIFLQFVENYFEVVFPFRIDFKRGTLTKNG